MTELLVKSVGEFNYANWHAVTSMLPNMQDNTLKEKEKCN